MPISPLNFTDFYKTGHYNMFPNGTDKVYSNLTFRKSRIPGVNAVPFFGLQYFMKNYLQGWWGTFFRDPNLIPKHVKLMDACLGKGAVTAEHLYKLQNLGFLPLHIKAVPEGTLVPIGIPALTITNTVDHAYWLVNYIETVMSCTLWQPCTSAAIGLQYKKLLDLWAGKTSDNPDFVKFQGHDFSMRGMSSVESARLSGAGHLLSFVGTDTIPAIEFLEDFYIVDSEKELVGCSVKATEHAVMSMGSKEGELETFERLIDQFPVGVLSIVSDTWDLWKVLNEYMPKLKDKIMARKGKIVIRPDSGDPADIICGKDNQPGVIELLYKHFGGTTNSKGYIDLDSHVGAIYGDSITFSRAEDICRRLAVKRFASTNVVFGIGSYTYQYNTRDTFGAAVKATYGEINGVGYNIFKDPITDDGTKKSAKGLLRVDRDSQGLFLVQEVTKDEEQGGELQTVFLNGNIMRQFSLGEIRARLALEAKTYNY